MVRNTSRHWLNRHQRGQGVRRPKSTGKNYSWGVLVPEKAKTNKSQACCSRFSPPAEQTHRIQQRNPPKDVGKAVVVLGRRSATESFCQRQGHL